MAIGNPGDASVGIGGFGGGGVLPSTLGTGSSSGGHGWFGSLTDPFGIVSSAKNLGVGIATGLGRIGYDIGAAAGQTAYNALSYIPGTKTQANWGNVGEDLKSTSQGVGDIGIGTGTMVESLASTAALPFGGTHGLTHVLQQDVFAPFNKWLAARPDTGNTQLFESPEMQAQLWAGGKGMQPQDFITDSEHHGIGAGLLNTALQVATVAAPFAEAGAAYAGGVADAGAIDATLADSAEYQSRLARANQINAVLQKAAHPVTAAATAFSGVSTAARNKLYPAIQPDGTVRDTINTSLDDQALPNFRVKVEYADGNNFNAPRQTSEVEVQAASDTEARQIAEQMAMTPQPGKSAHIQITNTEVTGRPGDVPSATQAAADAAAAVTADTVPAAEPSFAATVGAGLRTALLEAVQATTRNTKPFEEGEVPAGYKRLYRVGQEAGSFYTEGGPNAARATGTAVEDLGKVSHIDVPEDVAAAHKLPDGNYDMGAEALNYESVAHPEEAQPAAARVEPGRYKPGSNEARVGGPEARAINEEQIRNATSASRTSDVVPELYVFDQLGARINTPTPTWANWIVSKAPDSVNRLFAKAGHNLVTAYRMRDLYNNLSQVMVQTQRITRNSPMLRAATDAAVAVLSDKVGRQTAEARVAEELIARLNSEAGLTEWAKNHDDVLTPEQEAKIRRATRGPYPGVQPELLKDLTPDEVTRFDQAMHDAEAAYRSEAVRVQKLLLSSRYGAKGLEQALLGPDEVPMTPEQIRLYRRSVRDLQYAEKAKLRTPDEMRKLEANRALADATATHRWGTVDALRAKLGLHLTTVEELFRGVPEGLKDDGRNMIANIFGALGEQGGGLFDIGAAKSVHPDGGIWVDMAQQFDVPLADWATTGQGVLHEALFNPKDLTGNSLYDPQRLWGGQDARLAVRIVGDRVVGTIGQHSIGGESISPAQAFILGSAHEKSAGFNFKTGEFMPFSTDLNEQTLAKYYVGHVLNPKSAMNAWLDSRAKIGVATGITPDELNAEMMSQLWLDRRMSEIPGGNWKTGHIFNIEYRPSTNAPVQGVAALFQTVMPELGIDEHIANALQMADVHTVNRVLRWYYDSHDFIERAYRGKTVTVGGVTRDAAEMFYDVLALSSVMASPTQNLGRALMGFAHLDEFLGSKQGALDTTREVIDQAMGGKTPADVRYVVDLGKDTEHEVPKAPKGTAQEGTPVASRWLQSEAARPFSEQLSMTTGPKYRIIDALLGKFDLSSATATDIGGQPEWWNGTSRTFSDADLLPDTVIHHADLLGLDSKDFAAAAAEHERIKGAAAARADRGKDDYYAPITESTRDPQELTTNSHFGQGREVSLSEHLDLADSGKAFIDRAATHASAPVDLTSDAYIRQMYDATHRDTTAEGGNAQGLWGGGTLDTHTGEFIPTGADVSPDLWAVSTKERSGVGRATVVIDPAADFPAFKRQWLKAVNQWDGQLSYEGAGFGVFHSENGIELDPVIQTTTMHDTEAVGAYTHADGGAFHFQSYDGLWTPHVRDDEHWASKAAAPRAVKASQAALMAQAKDGPLGQAYQNALMEQFGSTLLAKLRSFRDNLAHPDTSLAVTLDSIMAQLFGYEKTYWGTKEHYAAHADLIRDAATRWSTLAGRQVMPHEVQALLWVYAKRFIGEQDWGRLQSHQMDVLSYIDSLEAKAKADGSTFTMPRQFDPFAAWHTQELEFSRQHMKVRQERQALRSLRTAANKGGTALTPTQELRLQELESYPDRMESNVRVNRDGQVVDEVRHQGYYDAKVLRTKNDHYVKYLGEVAAPVRKALNAGNFDEARRLVNQWVDTQKRSIVNGIDGRSFGWGMTTEPDSVAAQALERMSGKHVPSPNPEAFTLPELYSKFADKVKGATIIPDNPLSKILVRMYESGDVSTLLHEDLHAFRLHAPGDMIAEFTNEYPHIEDRLKHDGTPSALRVRDEERFVSDFMGYLRSRANGGTYTGPLADIFNRVAGTIDEHIGPALNTDSGKAVSDNVVAMWDRLFNPDIKPPQSVADPLRVQQAAEPRPVRGTPRQQRWESDAQYAARRQKLGEAKGTVAVDQRKIAEATQRAQAADRFANRMAGLVLEPTRSQVRELMLRDRANTTLDKLRQQLDSATGGQVPRAWRPYYDAIVRLREEIAADPSMAELADEIPQNFGEAMQLAAEQGFDPVYVPDLTYDMAQKYLFGHLQIGVTAEEASLRQESRGTLAARELTDRNLATLGSAFNIAMKEHLTSRLLQFIEETYARKWNPNTSPPRGWEYWNPARDSVLTGRHIERGINAVNADMIVPSQVVDTLDNFRKPPVNMPFRSVWKGPPMQVWKHLFLTFSPTWYIKHFVGSLTLASLGGARWQDWQTAFRQFKTNALPGAAMKMSIANTLDELTGENVGTLIEPKIKDFPQLVRSEGKRVAAREVVRKLDNVVATVDSISRAAVYARAVRDGASAGKAAYMTYEALGDFNRLGPFERSFVTSVIPFYTFQKAMFRVLTRLPVNHPVFSAVMMQLGMMHEAYMRDQLGGDLPDNYAASIFSPGGKLVKLDKLNPLTDSTRMLSLDGLVQSTTPLVRILAEEALHSPGYNAQAELDANGNLVPGLSIADAIKDTYTSGVPGMGTKPIGRDLFAITSQLSDKQYQSLLRRIRKFQNAKKTVGAGGYLTTDAYAPASNQPTGGVQIGR